MVAMTRRMLPRLLGRYLIAGLVIALVSAVGAIWLSSTTRFTYDQQRVAADTATDSRIYSEVLTWAGSHRTWYGIGQELSAADWPRRVVLRAGEQTIADTDPGTPLPDDAIEHVVDPLAIVPAGPGTATDDLDPRVVGAFQLTFAERAELARAAAGVVTCLKDSAATTAWETGRVVVIAPPGSPDCGRAALNQPVTTESVALTELTNLTNSCLLARSDPPIAAVRLSLGVGSAPAHLAVEAVPAHQAAAARTAACLREARITQARQATAPAVTVYTSGLGGDTSGPVSLSTGSQVRIALVVLVLLALVLLAATIIVLPTLRRVRTLTAAVERFARGERDQQVEVNRSDELEELARAFNTMSAEIAGHEEARRRLLGDVAHELRTPLTNIRGWIEAADDGMGLTDAELRALVDRESARLQQITADLQLVALAEAGELAVQHTRTRVQNVLDAVAAAEAGRARAAGVTIQVAGEGGLELDTDPLRLQQVLDNLVANALRHTPEGGVVTLAALRAPDGNARILVRDTGCGIPADELPRVFDRLWRGDPARARSGESTGLGLAIARGLVEALGGAIGVESEVGVGTVFTVELPGARSGREVPARSPGS